MGGDDTRAPAGRARQRAALLEMVAAFRVSQALYVAAALGIADHLADGPKDSDELARLTGAHAPSLHRLLRALAGIGVFAARDGARAPRVRVWSRGWRQSSLPEARRPTTAARS